MVGNGNFGGIRISEAEYKQSHIPGRILYYDVGLYSFFAVFTVYLRGRAQYQFWNGNVLGGVCL